MWTPSGAGSSFPGLTCAHRDESIKPPLPVEDYVRRLYAENDAPPQEEGAPELPTSSQSSASDTMVLPRYSLVRSDGHRRKANNELVSRTDPEAAVVSRRGFDMHLAYKAHMAVAGKKGQVITAGVANHWGQT